MNKLEMSQNRSVLLVHLNSYIVSDVSDQATLFFKWVIIAAAGQLVDLCGIVSNIVNIMCFMKQGFNEPINISLLGLAISDLCSLITLDAGNILYAMSTCATGLPLNPLEVAYIACALPHFAFARVSTWITVVITMERCLCVIVPLKVKQLVTLKRVTIIIVSLFILLVLTESPTYFVNKLALVFAPEENRTILALVTTQDREAVQSITFTINNFILPFTAFITIVISTVVLVANLQQRADWRKTSTTTNTVSLRNQKLGKMVVMISALFICCQIPCAICMLALAFEPGLNSGGRFVNTGIIIFGTALLADSINASANIFIYYHMSSKYRETLKGMFFKHFRKA